ncbi:MAG: hypothetical protein HRU09_10575 [Oligoflexales bacterium]|nr:hypothetical protein [Oligoflexales bacterium]
MFRKHGDYLARTPICLFFLLVYTACGHNTFTSGSSQSLSGKQTSDATELEAELNENSGSEDSKVSERVDSTAAPIIEFEETEEEEIVATRPVVISGAHLACVPADTPDSLSCQFVKDGLVIDLSSYGVAFEFKDAQGKLIYLETQLLDKKTYRVQFPSGVEADVSKLSAQVNIDSESYSIDPVQTEEKNPDQGGEEEKNEPVVDTDETPDSLPPEQPAPPIFTDLNPVSSCAGVSGDNVMEFSGNPDVPLNEDSYLVINADSTDQVDINLQGVNQIRGLCINADSNAVVAVTVNTHINQVAVFGNSNADVTLIFGDHRIFNQVIGHGDSNHNLIIEGKHIDCNRVNFTVNSNAQYSCSNPEE